MFSPRLAIAPAAARSALSSIGTTTDPNGRFRLAGLSGTSVTLDVRRIGFRPVRQTVTVGATNLRFALTEQSVALDEVVVTGTLGGQARREIGNAVSTVNAAEVTERGTVNNVQQLLNQICFPLPAAERLNNPLIGS